MENVYMCELSQKGPQVWWEKTSILLIFWKVFEIEENHNIFTLGQLKYKNSLIWMENVLMCEFSQKGPLVQCGRKLELFRFFEKFLKMKKIIIF